MNIPETSTLSMPVSRRNSKARSEGGVSGIDVLLACTHMRAFGHLALRVVLWDGRQITTDGSTPAVGMVINDRGALWRLLSNQLLTNHRLDNLQLFQVVFSR
jgi:hypothetical protein